MKGSWTYSRHWKGRVRHVNPLLTECSEHSCVEKPHLIVLLDTRESCADLRVAAPVISVTHNSHHLEFIQRSDKSRQSHSGVLLGHKGGQNTSGSRRLHQPCSSRRRSYLIIPCSKNFEDLRSHELMTLYLWEHKGTETALKFDIFYFTFTGWCVRPHWDNKATSGCSLFTGGPQQVALSVWFCRFLPDAFSDAIPKGFTPPPRRGAGICVLSGMCTGIHKKGTIPGSAWRIPAQRSISHHACTSSGPDRPWRREQCRFRNENLGAERDDLRWRPDELRVGSALRTLQTALLALDGVVLLHLRLVVIVQTVDRFPLHVVSLAALSVDCDPHFLQLLFSHLVDMTSSISTSENTRLI